MALNKVEICGVNTSRLPVLTNEEKELLFEKIKKGDKEARELYIKGNLRLVLSVIKRFSGSNENADDLFQIGCIGLMKAIDNFDTTLQVKFSTYAVPMIIGEIRRYLRDNSTIRVSRSLRDTAYKAIYARENYLKNNLREPTIMEIASEIGMEKEEIVYALDAIQSPMSLYEPVYTEGGDTLYVMDQVSDKKNKEENWVENLALQDAMNRLNDKERHIVNLRFYEGKTQMEVAQEIGISQAQGDEKLSTVGNSGFSFLREFGKLKESWFWRLITMGRAAGVNWKKSLKSCRSVGKNGKRIDTEILQI